MRSIHPLRTTTRGPPPPAIMRAPPRRLAASPHATSEVEEGSTAAAIFNTAGSCSSAATDEALLLPAPEAGADSPPSRRLAEPATAACDEPIQEAGEATPASAAGELSQGLLQELLTQSCARALVPATFSPAASPAAGSEGPKSCGALALEGERWASKHPAPRAGPA